MPSYSGKGYDLLFQHLKCYKTFSLFTFAFSLLLLLILSACSETFEPYQENDQFFFSIYGYLNAAADTQWVRVAPARQEFNMPAEVPDMEVTLEHLQSENISVMEDSLIVSEDGFNRLNFRSTMNIVPGGTYRLKAERPDGETSGVTVTTPEEFPTPRVRREDRIGFPTTYTVYVDDVEHLADVQSKWYVRLTAPGFEEERMYSFSYRNEAVRDSETSYRIALEPDEELKSIDGEVLLPSEGDIEVLHRQIYVASAGPEWDEEIASIDDQVYALPEGFSNVEDGLGYVVGIYSKWIPYESCENDQGIFIACPEEDPYW